MKAGKPQQGRGSTWAFMERFEIPDYSPGGDPEANYLTRWRIVQTPWFALYLHRIDTPDPSPVLHDHPWPFLAFVLRGGYVERRLDPLTLRLNESHRVRWVNRVGTYDAHAITRLLRKPTWTLLLVGPRVRTWGYLEQQEVRTGADLRYVPRTVWTEFDKHANSAAFGRALAQRRNGTAGS